MKLPGLGRPHVTGLAFTSRTLQLMRAFGCCVQPLAAPQHSTHITEEALRMEPKLTKNLGMLLLGIWLILGGLIPLLNLSFSGLGMLLGVLAVAAGVCILLGR
jgi:hypothetical protein